jgi:hypothetical protein
LSLEAIDIIKYVLDLAFFINAARQDVDLSEVVSFVDFNVYDVLSKRKYEASCTFTEIKDSID